MKVVLTGVTGFMGRYMASYLSLNIKEIEIYGFYNTKIPEFNKNCSIIKCNLLDKDHLIHHILNISPDIIIHMAGINHGDLKELLQINVIGTQNLLNAACNLKKKPRILVIGSSAEYGYIGDGLISEDASVYPVSEYGISKLASTYLALKYYRLENLPVTIVRPFNLIGPGQSDYFVCGKIVKQVCSNKHLKNQLISLKGINSRRDFIDVRDVVRALWLIASHDEFEKKCAGKIFNIGSGFSYSIEEIILISKN